MFSDPTFVDLLKGTHKLAGDNAAPLSAFCLNHAAAGGAPADTVHYLSEINAGVVGSLVDVSGNLARDVANRKWTLSQWDTGVLPATAVDSVGFAFDSGDPATSPVLATFPKSFTPNGSSSRRITLESDLLLTWTANNGIFLPTLMAIFGGDYGLEGTSMYARLLTSAPAYTESVVGDLAGKIIGPRVNISTVSFLDGAASIRLPGEYTFDGGGITGTVTHVAIIVDRGGANDAPLGTVTIDPAVVLTAETYTITYPDPALSFGVGS